jgi:hypothetical protein
MAIGSRKMARVDVSGMIYGMRRHMRVMTMMRGAGEAGSAGQSEHGGSGENNGHSVFKRQLHANKSMAVNGVGEGPWPWRDRRLGSADALLSGVEVAITRMDRGTCCLNQMVSR